MPGTKAVIPDVIVISQRECEKCGGTPLLENNNLKCPHAGCGKEFCNCCFKMHKPGDGNTVKCPHCGGVVSIHKVVTTLVKS